MHICIDLSSFSRPTNGLIHHVVSHNSTLLGKEALPWKNAGLLATTSFGRKMKDPMKK